tara:strand:+ start:470 stop:1588 length:1119 start_codon:yes stop_codon:yes gene_type:complete
MFVNVDWFFLSHRLPIAKAAFLNNIEMSVYTDISENNEIHDYQEFSLFQSPISRSSKLFGSVIIEFFKAYSLILNRKPDLIHAVTIKPIIFLGIISRLTKTPFVGAISGFGPVINNKSFLHRLRFHLVMKIYKFIFKPSSTLIICQSNHDKNVLIKNKICEESSITIIHGSGVDLEKFRPVLRTEEKHNILMASRMLVDKGIKEFCAAAKLIRDTRDEDVNFLLAGPIDELSPSSISIEEVTSMCKESDVNYLGNRTDINKLLASASIFILPSYYPEGIPKVLLEAAACGTPIITTDHPGCRDAVVDSETAILVEAKNYQAIVTAIEKLLDDPISLIDMGKAGRNLAEAKFDIKKVIALHYKLYNQLIENSL